MGPSSPVATSNDDNATLAEPEAIVLDGANGVTHAPRERFPHAGRELGVALVAVVLAVALRRFRAAIPVLLLLGALPGFVHVLWLRADSPLKRRALSVQIVTAMAELARHAPWPKRPVNVVKEDDDVLFPLLRYARPTRASTDGGVALEVGGPSLRVKCSTLPGRIICRGAR